MIRMIIALVLFSVIAVAVAPAERVYTVECIYPNGVSYWVDYSADVRADIMTEVGMCEHDFKRVGGRDEI